MLWGAISSSGKSEKIRLQGMNFKKICEGNCQGEYVFEFGNQCGNAALLCLMRTEARPNIDAFPPEIKLNE